MFDLVAEGLKIQQLTVNANILTDADVANIKQAGLRLVCKPDVKPSNVVSLDSVRVKRGFVEPMDAA